MPDLPQIGHQRVSREGIGLVEQLVHAPPARNGLGFVFRELPVVDGGLDGTIEVIGTTTDPAAMTGRQVSVQVKSGPSYLEAYGPDYWTYRAKFKEFEYWRAHSLPVLLLIADPEHRVVYWVRADDPSHVFLDASVAMRIPRAQTLGAAARDAIRQMAEQVSGTLDALLEPVPIRLARREIRDLAGGEPMPLAAAHRVLAEAMQQHGFRREASLEMARVAQYRWSSNDTDGAAAALTIGLQWAVEDLRDPSLSRVVGLRANTQPDGQSRADKTLWTESLSTDTRQRLDAIRALAAALEGHFEVVDQILAPYFEDTDATIPFEIRRVQAITITLRDLSEASAMACERAAAVAPTAAARDELRIRATWVRAMRTSAFVDPSANVETQEAVVVAEAQRAAGWTALNAGDLSTASACFVAAAKRSLSAHDIARAVRAYRNAGRADFLAQRLQFDDERPDGIAGRLEVEARRQTSERIDLMRLEEQAREAAASEDWATVRAVGERLRILGILEYDPTATQRGHTWLAVAWRAAARLQPDVSSLANAVQYSIAARALADESVLRDLEALVTRFAPGITDDQWRALTATAHGVGVGQTSSTTQLDLWLLLAPHIPTSLVGAALGALLIHALAQPWLRTPALDQRRKACDVVVAFGTRLGSELGHRLLPQVHALLTSIPVAHHERVVNAVSVIIAAAPPTGSDASVIANAVRAGLDAPWSTEWHRMAGLASQLLPSVDAQARELLLASIRSVASQGDLVAIALLADAEPQTFTTTAADAYLQRMQQLLDRQFAEIGGRSFGLGAGHLPALTYRAADTASEHLRVATGRRAIAFVSETGHLRMARRDWLSFATLLASSSPSLRNDVWQMLGETAATGLIEAEHVNPFHEHPLSPVRMDAGGQEATAMHAVELLAWTAEWAVVAEIDPLVAALQRATESPYPAIRATSARIAGGRGTAETPSVMRTALRNHATAHELLRALTRDPDDAVRLAAYEASDVSRDSPESTPRTEFAGE